MLYLSYDRVNVVQLLREHSITQRWMNENTGKYILLLNQITRRQ